MTPVEKIERTRQTIRRFIARTRYRAIPKRGLELVDRYNDLKAQIVEVGGYSNPDWRAYCARIGADVSHNGYDLFC